MQCRKRFTLAGKEGLDSITHTYTQPNRKAWFVYHLFLPVTLVCTQQTKLCPQSDCFAPRGAVNNPTGCKEFS